MSLHHPDKAPASIATKATTTFGAPQPLSTMVDFENIFDSLITQKDNEADGVESKLMEQAKLTKEIKKTFSDPSRTEEQNENL